MLNFVLAEDIPAFPVQAKILNAVKERVNMARDLDKLELQVRKANSESGWLEKAAEDMDIIIDDRYPFLNLLMLIYIQSEFVQFLCSFTVSSNF